VIGTLLRVRYELLQEIGQNPVFHSYVAHDRVTERNVVVRTLRGSYNSEAEFVGKLRHVFEKSKKIEHPAVARALEMDEDKGSWFLVYQYSPGQSLSERIRRASALGVSTAVTTAISLLEGLDAVHRLKLVHGEVGVRNVVVSNAGNATLLNPAVWEAYSASERAGVEMLPVLAPYLAPEVTRGAMPSAASDVYAMGVLLYEMLTGEKPYTGKSNVDLALAHATAELPTLRGRVAAVPEALEMILQKAMAKDPLDRYKDAGGMLADLRLLQDAMRFGRPLTWPLKAPAAASAPRVGPKLNVARGEEKEQRVAMKRAKETGDGAPPWLAYTGMGMLAFAVLAIGWWAFFNLSAPRTLKVPNIVGMSFNEASSQLDRLNLKLRRIREVPSEDHAAGIVLSVQPSVGRDVKEYMYVDAVVSSGSKFVEVPDLVGKSLDEARRLLNSIGLAVAPNIRYVRTTEVGEGEVVSQRPPKHTRVERRSQVELQVSEGVPPDETIAPPDTTYVYRLSWTLPDLPTDILVRVEMSDSSSTRTIYEQMKGPNEEVEMEVEGQGRQATFYIYYDNELVQTITKSAGEEEQDDEIGGDPPPVIDPDPEVIG
jgi:serine/threonine-protein kinase